MVFMTCLCFVQMMTILLERDKRNHRRSIGVQLRVTFRSVAGGDNAPIRSTLSSAHEFRLNANTNLPKQSTSFYLTRFEQQKKKDQDKNDSASSYFPPPQSDIKKSSSTYNSEINQSRIHIHPTSHDRTEQHWQAVPAPSILSTNYLSDSSAEPTDSSRIIRMATTQVSDDNQYSSATPTESLGTKITKLAIGTNPCRTSLNQNGIIENLKLHKEQETLTGTTVTSETDQGAYSDRQATHRDQTGFFSNREDLLNQRESAGMLQSANRSGVCRSADLTKSNLLTSISQPTPLAATPKVHAQPCPSNALSTSPHRHQSQNAYPSPHKPHHRHRQSKPSSSSSSSSSLSTANSNRNHLSPSHRRHRRHHHHRRGSSPFSAAAPHHRIVPFQMHHSSDSESAKQPAKIYSTRDDTYQTPDHRLTTHTSQGQSEDRFLSEQFHDETSTFTPNDFMQTPLDQVKRLYDPSLSTSPSLRKSFTPRIRLFDDESTRNDGILPRSTHAPETIDQHSKDFRRRRTDLKPVISSYPPVDENIYRVF